jgi:branched-subunit amino acid aminotransferase/4-amino-4-deoxychorismate lyase
LHGADEAVLLNDDGFVLEGALSSLVWWRGDVLCAPGDDVPWLPSVTRDQVLAIAEQSGYETRFEYVRPEDLAGLEIWVLSALHGIRVVTEWNDLPVAPGKATHVDAFNRRLRLLSTSID